MGMRQGKTGGSKLGKSGNEVGEVQELKRLEWSGDVTRYVYNLQRISYAITELSLEPPTKVKGDPSLLALGVLVK